MKKILPSIILALLLASCKNDYLLNDYEKNAVQKIADFYGGNCNLIKGFESSNTDIETYSELEVTESLLLEENPEKNASHSGNIAHLFYSNLDKDRNNHEQIRVKIITKSGDTSEFKYLNSELEEIEKFIPTINKTTKFIKESEFEKMKELFDLTVEIEAFQIEELFTNIENKFGATKDFQFQGFEVLETDNFGDIVQFGLVQITEKAILNINLNYKMSNKDLLSIEFD